MKTSTRNKAALIIFLEDYNRERVQSQFSEALESSDANALYRAFLEDTIHACLNAGRFEVVISYPQGPTKKIVTEAIANLRTLVTGKNLIRLDNATEWLWEQSHKDISKDMSEVVKRCFDMGYNGVLLVDCVTPTISRRMLHNACNALHRKDMVFGPTLEGSFYLLGMKRMIPELFDKMDWSDNDGIYSRLVEVVSEYGLDWEELEIWYNLRQPGDLEFLARDINAFRIAGDEKSAIRTEAMLAALINKLRREEV
jgi:glycosyltransferase A (GT-A) superfamily protein (DUF2064 family)